MKIQILMSTYNGGRYIRTQLKSIVAQTIKNKTLLIRDDGSTDNTIEIIQEYQKQYPWIFYYQGKNIGVQKSFLELIQNSDPEADYIAFSDQDDEWLPEKLERAVECLQKLGSAQEPSVPLLYCSDKIIVGEQLESLNVTVSRKVRKITFGNALVQNICTGCTAVLNRALLDLIRKHSVTEMKNLIMHDWWFYLTASCFGKVFYDKEAYIRYRQHGANACGAMLSRRALLAYRLNELKKPRGEIYRQVELFLETYQELLCLPQYRKNKAMAEQLLCCKTKRWERLKLAVDFRYFRQKLSDDLVFRGIVLIGKL